MTTPVLTALIRPGCFETITVMIQREVARRICAPAGSPDYGAFGIFVQWHMETELLFEVPPNCFVPQPKVTSAVIRLKKREKPPVETRNEKLLFAVVRAAFNQRRKTLRNSLKPLARAKARQEGWDDDALAAFLSDPVFDLRPERLGVEDFISLTQALEAVLK